MKIYSNLFAYLNQSEPISNSTELSARDRPIIVLEPHEDLSLSSWFITIVPGVYQIGFPYLQPANLSYSDEHNWQDLRSVLNLEVSKKSYKLPIMGQVMDLETIKEEAEIEEWENRLGNRLDKTVSELIRLFIGMFTDIFSGENTIRFNMESHILLSRLPQKLQSVNLKDANLPIVISLDKKYQLRRKLELIGDKLRHQLRRQAESMPVGKIQEMDSYCLRDYIRRPGLTAVEKAGSKQELMGIQRYQDFNTPENKFLVYFTRYLHLSCFQYERSGAVQFRGEVRKIRLVIDLFQSQPIVNTIQNKNYQFTKPNYVLQQNATYKSFYQAYLEYVRKRYEKEKLWSFRNSLLADVVYIYFTAALLKFNHVNINAGSLVKSNLIADQGCYLTRNQNVTVRVFLQNQVYVFGLQKPAEISRGDWVLTLEIHQLDSRELNSTKLEFPIWVFWYVPSQDIISEMQKRSRSFDSFSQAIVLYLQENPSTYNSSYGENHNLQILSPNIRLMKLPENLTEQGFDPTVEIINRMITNLLKGN
ncbi:hypothetical protein BCV63_00980 [Cylindrospermopsis raciborskii CS-508]|uniref:DUF2357 domain-containing protein n=1 Tax=Cylindrospermopsis raciborskii TaxID=77022 RepID=UPI0008DE63AD|nr:DUF2357 domain-containing protein [Cylindrospermopsis raciborskii]OHY35004.1 hypothetical protein BCV63_00980 [Cylindrospermopsis raciborskii CS-508]